MAGSPIESLPQGPRWTRQRGSGRDLEESRPEPSTDQYHLALTVPCLEEAEGILSGAGWSRPVVGVAKVAPPVWGGQGCAWICTDAYMLSAMESPAGLLRDARQSAGLSARALARLAQVPSSTVLRIESGKVDPTVGMLQRLLEAAGQDLHLRPTRMSPSQRGPVLAELADAWVGSPDGHPDWTKLRSFLDDLSLHPDRVETAIIRRPAKSPSPVLETLLAGIAEKLADDAGLGRPAWTRRTPGLREEWSPFGSPRMRARWRSAAPAQLLERGLVIDGPSLWRDPETVGV